MHVKITRYEKQIMNQLNSSSYFNYVGKSGIDGCPIFEFNKILYDRSLKIEKLLDKNLTDGIKKEIEYIFSCIRSHTVVYNYGVTLLDDL